MADYPVDLRIDRLDEHLATQLARSIDAEGKIPRALDALGSLAGRDVVLIDGGSLRSRQLIELGARLMVLHAPSETTGGTDGSGPDGTDVDGTMPAALDELRPAPRIATGTAMALGLPERSADVIVSCWSSFRGPSSEEVVEADRALRPDGRLLVLHDYGRDDVSSLRPDAQADHLAWSKRDGWFLSSGFKIRVIHCWWTFESIEEGQALLREAFGDAGAQLAAKMKRPRLSYNVAVYHRTRGDDGSEKHRRPEVATA